MFYAGVFPFLKFATKLMIFKYGVDANMAGLIPAMLPFGTIFLTPLFGSIYDKYGKGATLMIIGSCLLTFVHVMFALPINSWVLAIVLMLILGIAFGLVPSAMWPSVPKIIPMKLLWQNQEDRREQAAGLQAAYPFQRCQGGIEEDRFQGQ